MATTNQTFASSGRDTMERAADNATKAGNEAADAMKAVGRKASEVAGQAGELAHEQIDSMTAYVRKNPLQATAIAAGIGFAFALLARR